MKLDRCVARTRELMTILLVCHKYLKGRDYLAELGVTLRLPLLLIKHYIMKTYGGLKVGTHAFFTSVLD
jgi:hypothetical protein